MNLCLFSWYNLLIVCLFVLVILAEGAETNADINTQIHKQRHTYHFKELLGANVMFKRVRECKI